MKGMNRRRFNRLLAGALVAVLLLVLIACAPKTGGEQSDQGQTNGPQAPVAAEPTVAKDAAGVWTADAWKEIYPHEYETYMQNAMNSTEGNETDPHFAVRGDMVKMYPMLPVIWAGTGFNKFYNEP
ncbi:MAG: ammonia-forming cytochrome c nitrite reductase subunit c552, partial [Coriobacteriales bacterium]|nr:ammonia-forming cytochrome c nitrite reductase subunit c552 [Coriobacteriales bacterium]